MATPRRLVFGDVAELYDRNRPSYPQALVDDLIALAGLGVGRRALEVGAGTGKATRLLAARGVSVVAIEPSAEMAAVARRNLAGFPSVEIIETDFERWDPGPERFALLYSAQAWHWIDPEVRFVRARAALKTGGIFAAFWNRPAWGPTPLRDELAEVYRRVAPDMPTDGPMHPANHASSDDGAWPAEIAAVEGFENAGVRSYEWHHDYPAQEYAGLLATLSEIALLDETTRRELVDGVAAAIEAHGGVLAMPMFTAACLALAV
ncbi:MAG: class I SAM-dependent methyltransferase [Solirubrobacteraceae bacterium]